MDPTSEAVAMIHDGDRDATLHDFQRAMREGLPYEGEFRFVRRDGSVRHGHSIGHPVFDEHGELVEMVGTLIDTTDRKLAEEALRKARGELAHVSRVTAMGELTASIAHEVNQPLAAVVANASACVHWLDATPANLAEARAAAQRIVRDGKRASEVITRIRAFLMRGEPTKQALAIGEVIGDVIGMVQGEARAKGVSLEMQVSGPLRPVMGDRIQLQQVLLNLAVNAIEALAPVTGRDREVVIGAEEHDAQSLRVYVRDNGPGLDAQELDRIFDTFYTTKPEGMGMGLPISRTIVENHGGRLWAEPNEVCGEIFQFTLPVNGPRPR
jgi:C4-dicarboxylate-specific signal transduction histidine kinase